VAAVVVVDVADGEGDTGAVEAVVVEVAPGLGELENDAGLRLAASRASW
jgi:hypothetical protein